MKIHYDGWDKKWDVWRDYKKDSNLQKFAVAGSISRRAAHRFGELNIGDYVDINPKQRHPNWVMGTIRRLDMVKDEVRSGQIQV